MGCLLMSQSGPRDLSLLDRVEAYLREHRVRPSHFGMMVTGHRNLVTRLRAGRGMRRATIERIEAALAGKAVRRQPMTRGQLNSVLYREAVAEQVRADLAEQRRRMTDPLERAATHLRQRRNHVFRAFVLDGEGASGWYIGRERVDDEALLKRARREGWEG